MSNIRVRAGGSSASEVTRTPVSMVPPSERSRLASASVMAREPPSATGQPPRWPAVISMVPTAEVSGRSSGRLMWAAQPPKSARAASVRKRRARTVAGSAGAQPEPGQLHRVATAGARSGRAPRGRACRSGRRAGRRPRATGRRRRRARPRSRRPSRAAPPPYRRRAGARRRSPASARPGRARRAAASERKGEPTPKGWIAEQTSCSSPGTVSSSVRVPPPIVSRASSTVTESPRWASVTAAASPLGPEPTTTASSVMPPTLPYGVTA